jgi:hypothetical protein
VLPKASTRDIDPLGTRYGVETNYWLVMISRLSAVITPGKRSYKMSSSDNDMSRGDRDRYGYRHRDDTSHNVGESMPGDVGDSDGTFHDRAREDSNVIVDGEVRSIESHKRSSVEARTNSSNSSGEGQTRPASSNPTDQISQEEAAGKVVSIKVESDGGTEQTMGQFKNHQVHIVGGTIGEEIRVRLEAGAGYLIGRRIDNRSKS